MTYSEALRFLFEQLPMFQKQGKTAFKKDLHNIKRICEHLGNPQDRLRCIHIAGTNGKGSTAHIIASVLQASGRKVGLYTSPHYRDYRERVKVDGELVSEEFVRDFVTTHEAFIIEQQPSFFEITVAIAFSYFEQENVEVAVIETGLGGRLDSTNVIHPELSVITNIGLDHTWVLGNTLAEIAGEKAGIIKEGVPVVIGERQIETSAVFTKKANVCNSELSFAEEIIELNQKNESYTEASYSLKSQNFSMDFETDVTGPFQERNLKTALSAIWKVPFIITENDLIEGLLKVRESTRFIGRWMVLQSEPLILADSAHNKEGLEVLLEEVVAKCTGTLHIIMGIVKEKEPANILKLFPKDAHYYFTQADIPRAMPIEELAMHGMEAGLSGKAISNVSKAYTKAKANLGPKDVLLVTGSIYVLAEVI